MYCDIDSLSHRRREDLIALSRRLDALSLEQKTIAAFFAHRAGLVAPPLIIRMLTPLMQLRFGRVEGMLRYACALAEQAPNYAADLWRGVMTTMLNGRDVDDSTSAGGWNRRRLRLFLDIVKAVGWRPEAGSAPQQVLGGRLVGDQPVDQLAN